METERLKDQVLCVVWGFFIVALAWSASAGSQPNRAAFPPKFDQAMIAMNQRNYNEAIIAFREVLAKQPQHHRVRLELARSYFENGQFEDARREFTYVLSADIPDAVAKNIKSFLRAIDDKSGFVWTFDIGVDAGSFNNYEQKQETVDVKIGNTILPFQINEPEERGAGLLMSGSAEYRIPVAGDVWRLLTLSPTASGFVKKYENEAYDNYYGRVSITPQLTTPEQLYSVTTFIGREWVGTDPYDDEYGLDFRFVDRSLKTVAIMSFGTFKKIEDKTGNEAMDASEATVGLQGSVSLFAVAELVPRLSITRKDAEKAYNSFDSITAQISVGGDVFWGVAATTSIGHEQTHYDEPSPLLADTRRDNKTYGSLRLTKADLIIGGFSPYAEATYERNISSVGLYDYQDYGVTFGLTRAF